MINANTSDHIAILPCANTHGQRMSADRVHASEGDAGVQGTF